MARVRSERAASVTSGIARHKQAERKKASYKVVYEEISRKKKLQTFVRWRAEDSDSQFSSG